MGTDFGRAWLDFFPATDATYSSFYAWVTSEAAPLQYRFFDPVCENTPDEFHSSLITSLDIPLMALQKNRGVSNQSHSLSFVRAEENGWRFIERASGTGPAECRIYVVTVLFRFNGCGSCRQAWSEINSYP